jgi:alpha-tubulin suppressor-like RCC1 family protein
MRASQIGPGGGRPGDVPGCRTGQIRPCGGILGVLILITASCDLPTEPERRPSYLTIVSDAEWTGAAGTPLPAPLVVEVGDQMGPLAGVTVTWAASAGTVSTATTPTDSHGRASVTYTLGEQAGESTVTASVGELTPAVFTAQIVPGAAASLRLAGPTEATAGASGPYLLTALDQYGNVAVEYEGTKVLLFSGAAASPDGTDPSVADHAGSAATFGSETSLLFTSGEATAQVTLYAAETVVIEVSDGTLMSTGLVVQVDPAATVEVTITSELELLWAAFTTTFAAISADAWGNETQEVLSWVSSGTSASVDEDGVVTGVDAGIVTITASTPVGVEGRATITVDRLVQLTLGGAHSCAVSALGAGYCWGGNGNGELGTGGTADRVAVPTRIPGEHSWAQLSAGSSHTCGITSDATAYCWGSNTEGQLGDGSTVDRGKPSAVAGGYAWLEITAGNAHSCGITTSSEAYCWGYGGSGALGDGTFTSPQPNPSLVSGGRSWSQLSAGGGTCGVSTTGAAYCWGSGQWGQLGNGTIDPFALEPSLVLGDRTWVHVSAAGAHVCGMTTEAAYCWGMGSEGQLGDGAAANDSVPSRVTGEGSWSRVSAGGFHSCGISTAGVGYCWGEGGFGALGRGDFAGAVVPVTVNGGHEWSQLISGGLHTCGLTVAGGPYCWGYDEHGQVGAGAPTGGYVNEPSRLAHP